MTSYATTGEAYPVLQEKKEEEQLLAFEGTKNRSIDELQQLVNTVSDLQEQLWAKTRSD